MIAREGGLKLERDVEWALREFKVGAERGNVRGSEIGVLVEVVPANAVSEAHVSAAGDDRVRLTSPCVWTGGKTRQTAVVVSVGLSRCERNQRRAV